MIPLPFLEYNLSHPHPKGHWFLLATVVVFLAITPVLVLVNFTTLGFELVPTLRSEWRASNAPMETWWGTRRLPPLLRPRTPRCQPKDLGRGDNFRVTGSLFDYTVMSTWNTSHTNVTGVQGQERVEYKGESFANCYVSTARYDYSMAAQTHSVIVGVHCPGYKEYPIELMMQTTVTFSWELSQDFIGQYYGGGVDLDRLNFRTTDYRKTVLAVLEVISTDAISILYKPNLPVPPLSIRVFFNKLDAETAMLPNTATTSRLTYMNGTQPIQYPVEARIYINSIWNLVYVVMDAVNHDLGNNAPNMFKNASRFNEVVYNNGVPPGIDQTNWATGFGNQSWYYGQIPSPFQTWAQALRNGQPANISLANVGGPEKSVMATAYICPTYELKPTNALLSSVFVGSATMTLSIWGAWMFFTAFLARRIMAPQVICYCDDCKARRLREAMRLEEFRRRTANLRNAGIFTNILARLGVTGRPKNIIYPEDLDPEDHGYNAVPHSGRPMLEHTSDSKKASYAGDSPAGEK